MLKGVSPHRNSLEDRGPGQRERGSKGVDAEDLFGPEASGQQGEQEAHSAPRSAVLRGPTDHRQNPSWPLPLASLAHTFLASSGTAP